MRSKRGLCVFLLLVLCLLGGCASNSGNNAKSPTNETAISDALNYGKTCPQEEQAQLRDDLVKHRVQASFLGDQLFIIIPSHKIFLEHSSDLVSFSYPILDAVAGLLACYQKVSVKVIAYTNVLPGKKENMALSVLQAQEVMNYLWRKGVDSRLIYPSGKGAAKVPDGQGDMNRIEIVTRRLA